MNKLVFVLFIACVSLLYSQNNIDPKSTIPSEIATGMDILYSNLEYNTIAFDDLKEKWFLNDPGLVREIFNRFVVYNAFKINGDPVTEEEILQKANDIFEGNVIIDLRRRYYDDEIEYFAFVTSSEIGNIEPKPLFDPILDGFYLQTIIGNRLYKKIKEQSYFLGEITKEIFEAKTGYSFDINVNLLEPDLLLWSTTSEGRNKYLLSGFGKWGLDDIYLPGWFFSNYFVGARLTYYEALGDDKDKYTYSLSAAQGFDAAKTYTGDLPYRPVVRSGQSYYFSLSGDILQSLLDEFQDLYITFEGMMTIDEFNWEAYETPYNRYVYSVRNYFSLSILKRNLFDLFQFGKFKVGLGIAANDMAEYYLDATNRRVVDLIEYKDLIDRFENYANFNFGVEKRGGLVQFDLSFNAGYNATNGYLMYGAKAFVTLSNTIGVDVRFYDTPSTTPLERYPWRVGPILVFSPVIRINY